MVWHFGCLKQGNRMSTQVIVQYGTLVSLGIGVLGLAAAVLIHRRQVTTQIILELSARYDALLHSLPAGVWTKGEGQLPAATDEVTTSILRYCSLASLSYFLFQRGNIPRNVWELVLPSVVRTLRSPLFLREWGIVRSEFESFPDFVAFVTSIQASGRPSDHTRIVRNPKAVSR